MRVIRNERGVILSWFVKILLMLAVFGVIIYDGAVLAVNFFGLDSAADDMAVTLSRLADERRGGTEICSHKRPTNSQFCVQALDLARAAEARLVRAEVTREQVVEIELRRRADTLIVHLIPPLKSAGVATAQGRSGTT